MRNDERLNEEVVTRLKKIEETVVRISDSYSEVRKEIYALKKEVEGERKELSAIKEEYPELSERVENSDITLKYFCEKLTQIVPYT